MFTPESVQTLSNEDLDTQRLILLTDAERRSQQERTPGTIRDLARQYVRGGGDVDALRTVLDEVEEEFDAED